MKRYYLLYSSFYLIFLAGCAPNYSQQSALPSAKELANNPTAQKIINTKRTAALSSQQRHKLNLLSAQVYLRNGHAEKALTKLSITDPYYLSEENKINYYKEKAFAYSLQNKEVESVKARIQLSQIIHTEEQRNENNIVILDGINRLSPQHLNFIQTEAPPALEGWLALSSIYKNQQNGQNPQSSLAAWKQRYSKHPANSGFLLSYFNASSNSTTVSIHNQPFTQVSSVALLLPQSGRYAKAAKAVKEGFINAYTLNQSGFQPILNFYDTASVDSSDLYQQAILEGAELIIGPLSKENIQNIADHNVNLTTPILALNHIPNLVKNNLYQFGLSPIDESNQVANHARGRQIKRALLITPQTRKGERTSGLMEESWQALGGTLLEAQTYDPRKNDFSPPIKRLLNLDKSQSRYKQLKRVLGKNIKHKKRTRQDAGAIFLSASPKTARSIYPQLQFYGATKIPVYMVSQFYTGLANPSKNRDLNNITFCDIPWLFPTAYSGSLDHASLKHVWRKFPNKHLRLIALGMDAFNLIGHLNGLTSAPYSGTTGTLSLNAENRVTRELVCAKFINGEAILQTQEQNQFIE